MEYTQENGSDYNINGKATGISWGSTTNWIIAHGSLEDSVTVESSDCPFDDKSELENTARKSPLVLKPPGPDSGPCEIKIHFEQKYEIGQIYVRSTARVYEVYYAHSPHSSNEYLCTVRCGAAERDEKLLQTNCFEDVVEEHGECLLGEPTEETVAHGGSIVISEDDWVKIKVPEVGRSSASDVINTNGVKKVQDLYEATAQISDADPCLLLTIRLLSLQDKGLVYVDEVYVFVDPVESIDSGNDSVLAGSSTESSLMAMFVPTLLQLSKSSVKRVQDKCASDEVVKDDKMETGSSKIDEVDTGLDKNQVNQENMNLNGLDKDTAESAEQPEHQQPTSAKKCVEPINLNYLPPQHLETALQQLISRVSRVEDICLRFEEKLLKPIESIEARLQRVEHQLEKLAKDSHYSGLLHGTRISAPAFSCSESNSSSFYDEQSDFPPCGPSDLEKKDISCNDMPELSHDANSHPSLIVDVPERSCDEDKEDNDDLKPLKDSPCVKPKKTLSVDDALAAALNGFLSTAVIHPSEHIETSSQPSREVDEENQYQPEPCQIKPKEFPAAENGNRASSGYARVLTIKAPDFASEEICEEEHFNYNQSSLDTASLIENKEKESDHGDEMVPRTQSKSLHTSRDSCDFVENETTHDSKSASNGHLNGSSEVNVMDGYFEGDSCCNPVETSNDSGPDLAKDSLESGRHQINGDTNQGKTTSFNRDDKDIASEHVSSHEPESESKDLERHIKAKSCLKDDTPFVSETSRVSLLDFEFPILEVKFTSNEHTSTKSALEALLNGSAVGTAEAPSTHDSCGDDGNTEQIKAVITNGNEAIDRLPINHLLVDVGVSAADGSSILEGGSLSLSTPSTPEMNASLI